jgi:hypothetical protein
VRYTAAGALGHAEISLRKMEIRTPVTVVAMTLHNRGQGIQGYSQEAAGAKHLVQLITHVTSKQTFIA